MKKTILYAATAAIAAIAVVGCSSDEPMTGSGEGTIYLSTKVSTDVRQTSRATEQELLESCIVWISNPKGVVRKYNGAAEMPSGGIKLLSDRYVAEAWAGDSVPASFDDRYFKGREEFTVSAGSNQSVSIVCKIANSAVKVTYADDVDGVLSDYVMTVGHSQGSLDFVGRTDATGYFMMNSRDKNLTWTLKGKLNDGSDFERQGTIEGAKPTTLYNINVECPAQSQPVGGAYLTITVDEETIDIEDEIEITAAPTMKGIGFALDEVQGGEAGQIGRKSVWVNAQGKLQSLILTSDYFTELLGIAGNDFDLLRMTDEDLKAAVAAAGINFVQTYDAELDVTAVKLNFEGTFTDNLPDGEYNVAIDATDEADKTGHADLRIKISADDVTTEAIGAGAAWATRATVGGVINKDGISNPVMKYREKGTLAWTEAATTVSGKKMQATLTGLKPATTYEFIAASDGFDSGVVCEFTTEEARQLPNAGFEESCTVTEGRNSVTCFYAEGGQEFWDSGNHGSATMSKQVTYLDSEIAHTGHSVCLNSQFVGVGILGKFAAGNIFIGDYLRTAGTNGVLGWGRPWASRPSKLHGWIKYSPVAVTADPDIPADYTGPSKGEMDNGTIYIALLDDQMMHDKSETADYPVVIATAKPKKLFDKNGSNVIGYGELVLKEATAGDGMIEFTINIEYRRTDVTPTYIMCTASASIGGDYFSGGDGSKMWLDDLELIYE